MNSVTLIDLSGVGVRHNHLSIRRIFVVETATNQIRVAIHTQ